MGCAGIPVTPTWQSSGLATLESVGSEVTHLGCQGERNEGCWELLALGGNRSGDPPGAHLCPPH